MQPIKLNVIKYYLDISKKDEREEYEKICSRCIELNYKLFDTYAGDYTKNKEFFDKLPAMVTIETEHLFSNQYSTAEGMRVFDWSESIFQNKDIKQGYYLDGDGVELLKRAKDDRLVCGYCGKQQWIWDTTDNFCRSCINSQYLTEKDLPLLRYLPVSQSDRMRSRSGEIPDSLKKEFAERGVEMERARIERLKLKAKELAVDLEKKQRTEQYETAVKIGLLNAGFDVENLIYYSHQGRWVYGWYKEVTREEFHKFLNAVASITLPLDKNGISFANILHKKGDGV